MRIISAESADDLTACFFMPHRKTRFFTIIRKFYTEIPTFEEDFAERTKKLKTMLEKEGVPIYHIAVYPTDCKLYFSVEMCIECHNANKKNIAAIKDILNILAEEDKHSYFWSEYLEVILLVHVFRGKIYEKIISDDPGMSPEVSLKYMMHLISDEINKTNEDFIHSVSIVSKEFFEATKEEFPSLYSKDEFLI